MKILVTGASGFIGREIVSELVAGDHQVIAVSRSEKNLKPGSPNVTFYKADITDAETFADFAKLEDVDAIVHSAGLAHQFGETTKAEFDLVNVKGTEKILNLASKLCVKHFILIGSTAIYGTQENSVSTGAKKVEIDENTPPNPQTLYAESKLEGENICRNVCETEKIPLTIFRLAPVIGEGNAGNTARLIEAIDRKRFVWIGDGTNLKSLIDKRDVARACRCLIENKKNGTEVFNLAAAPIRMKDFVNEIASHLKVKIAPVKIPAGLMRGFFRLNAGLFNLRKISKVSETVEKWLSDDIYEAEQIFIKYGFQASTPISEAIKRQIDFYLANKNKQN